MQSLSNNLLSQHMKVLLFEITVLSVSLDKMLLFAQTSPVEMASYDAIFAVCVLLNDAIYVECEHCTFRI